MRLSSTTLSSIPANQTLVIPPLSSLALPEKVVMFGTGVLLRGLPNYFIDKANRQGIFQGRIVVVKSTGKGTTDAFAEQNGLYTLCVRGIENGRQVEEQIIQSSISRVLSAQTEWEELLACAENKDIRLIVSNTTEAGIKLVRKDSPHASPPSSFPGKLLAFLYRRFHTFKGSKESGMVILPTELVPNNGDLLKSICLQLAEIHIKEPDFTIWLKEAHDFCNTLVDRIVPGALPEADQKALEEKLEYEDSLMIMAEPYRLWAIETSSPATKALLSFSQTDEGVILADNINKHREIKLRLLNAPHTFTCALALWCGFSTVKEAMQHETFKHFITDLMLQEIIPFIIGKEISEQEARAFAHKVLDRFSNPFIAHEWMSISAQYTSKMLTRCIPLLLGNYARTPKPPHAITLGVAAYLLFMRSRKNQEGQYIGTLHQQEYIIYDDKAAVLYEHWQEETTAKAVHSILSDEGLWNCDLTQLPEFAKRVYDLLQLMKTKSPETLLQEQLIVSPQ